MRLTRTHSQIRTCIATVLTFVFCMLACATAFAANIPWNPKARFQYVAQKKDLRELLREFAISQGLTISISEGVEGSVSGKFDLKPQAMLDLLTSSNGLIWYYDGSLLHVMPASSVRTDVIQLRFGNIENLREALNRIGILDQRYPLQDDGNGAVVISGPAPYVDLVNQIVENMEGSKSRNQATEVRIFPLRFAWATDHEFTSGGKAMVIPGVASVLRSMYQSKGGTGPKLAKFPDLQKVLPETSARVSNEKDPQQVASQSAKVTGGQKPDGMRNTATDSPEELPIIQADSRINAVLVRDIPSRMMQYESLIRTLDVRPQMIEIEARIIEVSSSEMGNLGVNWRLNAPVTVDAGNTLSRLSNVRDFVSGGDVLKTVLNNAGLNLLERISVLADQGKANITASPTVLTLNNLEARMDNQESFFIRVAGYQNAELFNVSAGVTMHVTPLIVSQGKRKEVKLDVRIQDGRITDRTVDQIPVVSRSEINTQAYIKDGEALLIAGYGVEQESNVETKVPGLSAAPLFGGLFRSQDRKKSKTQRMFLLIPHIVEEEATPSHEALGQMKENNSATENANRQVRKTVDESQKAVTSSAAVKPSPSPSPSPLPHPPMHSVALTLDWQMHDSGTATQAVSMNSAAPISSWEVTSADKTLKGVLARWAAAAGWQMVWTLPVDYEIEKRGTIQGSFENAVESMAHSLKDIEPPIKVIFYKANKVVRVIAKES